MNEEVLAAIKVIHDCIEEYKTNPKKISDILDIVDASIKLTNKSKKKYVIFNALNLYLDKSIMLLHNELHNNSEYQELIGYCRTDLEYYLDASMKLKEYFKKIKESRDFSNLEEAYILSLRLSMILANINDYFQYIKEYEKYANSFIQYCMPAKARNKGMENINEIDMGLKKLGLKEEA